MNAFLASRSVGWLLFLGVVPAGFSQVAPARPTAGRGPNASTLLVYTARRTADALADELESLQMRLQQVQTRLECVPVPEATPERIHAADYMVVFCPQTPPRLPAAFLQAVAAANQPVLWIGFGAEQLAEQPPFRGQYEIVEATAGLPAERVDYRGRSWSVRVDPWIGAVLPSNSTAQVLMSVPDPLGSSTGEHPLCWKSGSVTFLANVPSVGPMGFLFSDLLWDFYGVKDIPAGRVFLRIEDYHCRSRHRAFRRMVDYLYSRHHPFLIAVIPASLDPVTGQMTLLDAEPEFVAALRYAQQRGGRLLMHGYFHAHHRETGEGHEFWDVDLNRPFPDETPESIRERLLDGVRQMLRHELFPLAWETPHYAASRQAYREIARVFSTAVERVQLGDASCLENFTGATLTTDVYGRCLLPENAGYVLNQPEAPLAEIKAMGQILVGLRGTVTGCYIHPYQPLGRLVRLVETLESWQVPFLDLADLDNAVQLPEALLLTGHAQRRVSLRPGRVRRKLFDRGGHLLSQETEENLSAGSRLFTGAEGGGYELVEFLEANP